MPTQFQSTHPSGVRPWSHAGRARIGEYFNPRTPVGCDQLVPPRGAGPSDFNPRTPVGCDFYRGAVNDLHGISIHAPQWGATHPAAVVPRGRHISIHAPQWGATARLLENRVVGIEISIHAPQWGATRPSTPIPRAPCNFNPRTPVGCDDTGGLSTPSTNYFNPRTPVGCDDPRPWATNKHPTISIHAPQWGATSTVAT